MKETKNYLMRQRDHDPNYQAHKGLRKLITHKEVEEREEQMKLNQLFPTSPNIDFEDDFMTTQERNVNIPNYNFEQYTGFTKTYKREMVR